MEDVERCPGCGIVLPVVIGVGHTYMLGSPSCWRGYGGLLAAQYADQRRMAFHQLVVDAYAVQHPGGSLPQQVQSVGIHLMTLALVLEDGAGPESGPSLHRAMVMRPVFHPLTRPDSVGELTFDHVPLGGSVSLTQRSAYEWARSAWEAWAAHHETVDQWLRTSGLR